MQFKQAGVIACLVFCAACAEVALVTVTPMIAAVARHFDEATGREIVKLENKQDWPGMLAMARAQLQRDPGQSDWWFLQGYALSRQGQHAAAIESYQRAIRISPEEEGSWLALARSQKELGRSDAAMQTYRQALRYRPESAQAYLGLADVQLEQGRPDLAIPNYRESVRYDPASMQGWYGLTAAYQITGQRDLRDEALKTLRKLDAAAADQVEKQRPSK